MLDQDWTLVITIFLYIIAYFFVAKPMLERFSIKVKGRNYVIQSPTTFDLSTPDGRWDVLMNILVIVVALFVALLIFFLGSEIGVFRKMY